MWSLREVEEHIKNAGLKWSVYQQKYKIKRGGKTRWLTLDELTKEYRGIVERIPNYIIEAAKGRIRVNGIQGSIAKRILLQNGKRQTSGHDNEKVGMENRNTDRKKRNAGNNDPNRDRRRIQKQEKTNT